MKFEVEFYENGKWKKAKIELASESISAAAALLGVAKGDIISLVRL